MLLQRLGYLGGLVRESLSSKFLTPFDVFGEYIIFYVESDRFSEKSRVVGSSACLFMNPVPYKHSKYWTRALELEPSLSSFDWPDRSVLAEKTSFRLQCDKHNVVKPPSESELLQSREILLPQYLRHELPSDWSKEFLLGLQSLVSENKQFLKADSTPGVPYAMAAGRNDQLLEMLGQRFDELVIGRIVSRSKFTLDEIRQMTREELIINNLVDPVRVFVKGEPHKIKKIREGRVRLIMSVSIVDKMVEMVLMRHLAKLEIQNWKTLPSKPGIGFSREDVRSVYKDVMDNLPMAATDIEAWDWSCQEWQLVEEAECAIELCRNATPEWSHLIRATALIESRSTFQFSDGLLVAPDYTGIVNSGKFKTSRGNSFMRCQLAALAGSVKCVAAGDDTVEKQIDGAVEKYASFGFKIKAYDAVTDRFEFCSRVYTEFGSWPVNFEKILMNLLHNVPKTSLEFRMYMTQFVDDLEYHPDFERIMKLVESTGYYELAGAQEIVGENVNDNATATLATTHEAQSTASSNSGAGASC